MIFPFVGKSDPGEKVKKVNSLEGAAGSLKNDSTASFFAGKVWKTTVCHLDNTC